MMALDVAEPEQQTEDVNAPLSSDLVIAQKYRVLRKVGEGGMGTVYEALHTGTGRRLAIKVLTGAGLDGGMEAVARFEREARTAGSIDTQHIVTVLDTGTDASTGHPYMVMELLTGEDVQQLLDRQGPVPPEVAVRIVAQACIGLSKAHERGVIHRDIKPANLFLARRDDGAIVVKLLDFGIAKVKADPLGNAGENAGLTRTGNLLGSPLYMSPEQTQGLKTMDHRTDLWSLGVVLYEALCGRPPHVEETIGQLILAICARQTPPVQQFAPWVPAEIAEIVDRALRIKPEERYSSAGEMLAALREVAAKTALTQEDLVPVDETSRRIVRPRFDPMGQTRVTTDRIATAGPLARSGEHLGRPRALWMAIGLGALSAIGLVLLILKVVGGPKATARGTAPPTTATSSAPAASATGATTASAPEPSAAAPIAPPLRTVQLTVRPARANVEVDGVGVESKHGTIEIAGALGSVHEVRAKGSDRVQRVVVTEGGAVPQSIDVGPVTASGSGGTASGSGGTATQPIASASASAKPLAPPAFTIDKSFEK
jgi:eukaryotic-like serine/threonine-protein kinase